MLTAEYKTEHDYEIERFPTREEAESWLMHQAKGTMGLRGWIDNVPVHATGGFVKYKPYPEAA